MSIRGDPGGHTALARVLLAVALLAIVAGPVYVMLAGAIGLGALIFAAGLVLMGSSTLLGGGDRAAAGVLISIGVVTAAVDLLRLLIVGAW